MPGYRPGLHVVPTRYSDAAMSTRYTLGREVGPEEDLHDSCGNRIDEDYVEHAVSDVQHALGGRSSLSDNRIRSPQAMVSHRN
jgi:hypothetical protein